MMSHRVGWIVQIVVLAVILILAGRVAGPPWGTVGDPSVSAVRERLTALAACVLPASGADPSAAPASPLEPAPPDCDPSVHDRLHGARMTAC